MGRGSFSVFRMPRVSAARLWEPRGTGRCLYSNELVSCPGPHYELWGYSCVPARREHRDSLHGGAERSHHARDVRAGVESESARPAQQAVAAYLARLFVSRGDVGALGSADCRRTLGASQRLGSLMRRRRWRWVHTGLALVTGTTAALHMLFIPGVRVTPR